MATERASPPATGRRRAPGLGTWLGAGSAVIVLLAVLATAGSSIGLLRRLADQQAMARVELAGVSAREYLRRVNEEVLSDARVLAGRPTLARLVSRADRRGLTPFLRQYAEASNLFACAVLNAGGVVAVAGGTVPWAEVADALTEQGERFVVASRDSDLILSGAVAPVSRPAGVRVIALRAVDKKLIDELASQLGAKVNIVNYATYTAPPEDAFTALHTAAISAGRAVARRLDDPAVYAAAVPWSAVTGELIGLIDVQISTSEFDASVRSLGWRLAAIALVILCVAVASGLWYGQRLARPLATLRKAADRIGRGDFSVAMPSADIDEIQSLAATMEEMRRNLVELTAVLRRRDAEARAVLSGVVEGVFAVDKDRVIRYANEQVSRTLGRPVEDIVGRFCGDVLNPEASDGQRPCDRNCPIVAARQAGRNQATERLRLPDGSTRSVVIVSAAPTDGQQVQVMRDETELESVRRARDTVLANISHEFRTPLAAQLASIELLQDGLDQMTAAEQRELFQNLERGVLRLMRLIDNLLESVRIESGQLGIRQQSVDIASVAEEAQALVRPLLGQRRQTVSVAWPASMPTIVGDEQRLTQAFVNLLANAGKYAPEGSEIRMGGEIRGDRLFAWVEDEGPGPGEGDPAALFQRFQRAGDVEPEAPGLGLGLWIVRSIAERHGGHAGMERTAEGRTRFFISLPTGERP